MNASINKKHLLTLVIYSLLLLAGTIFLYHYRNDFALLSFNHPLLLVPLLMVMLLFTLSNGALNNLWFRAYGAHLNFLEYTGLSVVNALGNCVTPFRGGALTNAYYLKKHYNLDYLKFLNLFAATNILIFWLNSLLGLLSLLLIYLLDHSFSWLVLLVFVGCLLLFTLMMYLPGKLSLKHLSLLPLKIKSAILGFREIKNHQIVIVKTLLYALLNILLIVVMTILEFKLLNINITIAQALFLSIFSAFAQLLSLTPANLGIREGFMLYAGTVIGLPLAEVVVVSAIDRIIFFILTLLLSFYFTNYLICNKNQKSRIITH
ncbi:MAG: flippase-like domain-containing protein [Oligoflexia bacterium]|nr:flippase-like domain-containing protein [Oligoflexia bacterium]MBF0365005.1 flippase-like domain-containing protein [Oligoflexia bacterium]